jgi:hypothetical protein
VLQKDEREKAFPGKRFYGGYDRRKEEYRNSPHQDNDDYVPAAVVPSHNPHARGILVFYLVLL